MEPWLGVVPMARIELWFSQIYSCECDSVDHQAQQSDLRVHWRPKYDLWIYLVNWRYLNQGLSVGTIWAS